MTTFLSLQQNSLVSYKPNKENKITNPINLSPNEIKLFSILKEIIEENKIKNIKLLAVGGWVRDHLLNMESNDLDIVIKGISSKELVILLNKKVKNKKYIMVNNKVKKQEGKEINLTKTTICDIMIDFVELVNDNILEDAKCRDFTFNAIYYNILENKIEDVLNFGINDLKNGFIRTCIPPHQLFNNDSLNILRMLRFATKFQFVIDDECLKAIDNNKNEYQNILLNKINKERIHKELFSIFTSSNPSFAIYTLYKYNLLQYVLHLDSHKNDKNWLTDKDILNIANIFVVGKICFDKYKTFFEKENYDNQYKCSYYSVLLTILMRNFTDMHNNILSKVILAKVLKIESKKTLKIINHFDEFNSFISNKTYDRLNVGVLLRKILLSNISQIILISVANEYVTKTNVNILLDNIDNNELDQIFNKYYYLYEYIKKENLEGVNDVKSIIDGKEIKKIFKGLPEKYLGTFMEGLVNKQIETKGNFTKDDAINFIKYKIDELKIELNS